MDGNTFAAQFIRDANWDDLPDDVQHKAKMCLVDITSAMVSGVLTPISDLTADYAPVAWAGNDATILLHNKRASVAGAAYANATAANGLDSDDAIAYTRGHPGAQVFPTALALSESLGLSGKEMLTAVVVGYEIASRHGRCWHDHLHPVYQACGSWGSVACAATAAKLMGLDIDTTKHALGIAEYHAPNSPMERDLIDPTMVKSAIPWAAMTGVISAELAQRGFTGVPGVMGFEKYNDWVTTLGNEYIMLDGVDFKSHCSCGWGHMAIQAAKNLKDEHDWNLDDIEAITVKGYYWTTVLHIAHPTTTEEAQYSVKWPLAAYLVDGEIGPDQILEARFGDEHINVLVDKIELVESEEFNRLYQPCFEGQTDDESVTGSQVFIRLKDGRTLDSGLVSDSCRIAASGDEQLIEKKFRWLCGYVLEKDRTEQLLEMLWNFEKVPNVAELTALLRQR